MRALVLAAAALLAAGAVWWLGQAQTAQPQGGLPMTVETQGVQAPGAASLTSSPPGPAEGAAGSGREAATVSPLPPTPKGHLAIIVTAPAEWATSDLRVLMLSLKQYREGIQQKGRTRRRHADGPDWRWENAVAYGMELENVPAWTGAASAEPAMVEARVFVRSPSRGTRIFARLGSRVGTGIVPSSRSSAVEIDLTESREFIQAVQVVYADGEPAEGITLTSAHSGSASGTKSWSDEHWTRVVERARTGADGRAEVSLGRWDVPAAVVAGHPLVKASADAMDRIVLPPVGSIEVKIVPAPKVTGGGLQVRLGGGNALRYDTFLRVPIEAGRARLSPVILGKSFHFAISTPLGSAETEAPGPQAAGETAQVELPFGSAPRIRATLVDTEGKPLAGARVTLSYGEEKRRTWRAAADREGDVQFWLEESRRAERWGSFVGSRLPKGAARVVIREEPFTRSREGVRLGKPRSAANSWTGSSTWEP